MKAGADLLKALQVLFAAYPGLRDRVLTEAGELRAHLNIFVANEDSWACDGCSGRGGSFDYARDQRRLKARAIENL